MCVLTMLKNWENNETEEIGSVTSTPGPYIRPTSKFEGILPKGPYPPCLRMADRALLAGYPRNIAVWISHEVRSHIYFDKNYEFIASIH